MAGLMLGPISHRLRPGVCAVVQGRAASQTSTPRQQVTLEADKISSALPASEIPGPRTYPIIGMLPTVLNIQKIDESTVFNNKKIHEFWSKLHQIYGPIVKFVAPGIPPMVGLLNPDDCETVMRTTMDNPIREGFNSLKHIRANDVDDYFEKKSGLLTENGEEWWRVRSRVQTPMLKVRNVSTYIPQMDEVSLDFLERIATMQKDYGEMQSDFQIELYKWALESVGLVALSRRMGCLDPNIASDSEPMKLIQSANNIFEALNDLEVSAGLWKILPTKAYKRLQESHQIFLRTADRNIQETEARLKEKLQNEGDKTGGEELTLMETLLMSPGLTYKDVVTLILDMLFAGIDTTSHSIGFTLYLLSRNPEVQAKLQKEVDEVLKDDLGPLTSAHLARLSYLKAVVKESHRAFPITLGNSRILLKDTILSGYVVPKGWMAVTLNMLTGWEEQYFPKANEFIPERWLRHKPLGPIHPYASLPFGTGTRMCIGRRIAEQEMYIFLARAMQRFTVDYKYKDMDIVSKMVLAPSEPLKFTFTERR